MKKLKPASFDGTTSDKARYAAHLIEELSKLNGAHIAVGFFTKEIAFIAAVNEFGTKDGRIPARSVLRSTVDENEIKYRNFCDATLLKIAHDTRYTGKAALTVVGQRMVNDVKKKITSHPPPPNADSTVERKGFQGTWIESGATRRAVTNKIYMHGEKEDTEGQVEA